MDQFLPPAASNQYICSGAYCLFVLGRMLANASSRVRHTGPQPAISDSNPQTHLFMVWERAESNCNGGETRIRSLGQRTLVSIEGSNESDAAQMQNPEVLTED